MASISMSSAWIEASAFVKREAGLLFPVALLFIGIPFAVMFYMLPADFRRDLLTAGASGGGGASLPVPVILGMLLCVGFALIGSLALYALALKPGISVAEALQRGFRRAPILLGATLLIGVALALALVVPSALSPAAGVAVFLVAGSLLSLRLLPLNAVVVATDTGVIQAIRASWMLTRGHMLRLAAAGLMIVALSIFLELVAQMLFGIGGFVVGGTEGGRAGANLGSALAASVAHVYVTATLARIYLQLTAH